MYDPVNPVLLYKSGVQATKACFRDVPGCLNLLTNSQWLEQRWLVSHGEFELVFEYLGNTLDSSKKYLWIF